MTSTATNTKKKLVIFNLGTNNWQKPMTDGELEFAPGSGVLHASHHYALNDPEFHFGDSIKAVNYSIYPSHRQRPSAAETSLEKYRVFELEHPIPICESCSPTSGANDRWHGFSEERMAAYLARLQQSVEAYIAEIEAAEKQEIGMMIAHHCFTNPVVLTRVNEKRIAAGKSRIPIFAFAHGTALKMYKNELQSKLNNSDEYPLRFYPWINKLGIFDKSNVNSCVDGVFVISEEQKKVFVSVFPDFETSKIKVAPNGFNQSVFKPPATPAEAVPETASIFKTIKPVYAESVVASLSSAEIRDKIRAIQARTEPGIPLPVGKKIKIVFFCGKTADWKRWDVMEKAHKIYCNAVPGTAIITIVAGSGPESEVEKYHRLAFEELQLDPATIFFVGPLGQDILSKISGASEVFLSAARDEPFGLVCIESFGCGTPVISANSGGPRDFITPEVGALVSENDDHDQLATAFARVVTEAIVDDWKSTKGKRAAEYAAKDFTTSAQCRLMMDWAMKKSSAAIDGEQEKKASLLSDYMGVVVVGAVLALGLWKQYGSKL